jgi:hypothetical protein
MDFDGAGRNIQFIGDDFVGPACDQMLEHLPLAHGKQNDAAFRTLREGRLAAALLGKIERPTDAIEHQLLVIRLLDEIHRSRLHRAHRQRHIAMTDHDDHRQSDFGA